MTTLWSSDFSNGFDTGGTHNYSWQDTPWNDTPQGTVKRPTIVTSPSDPTKKAARFSLAGGQQRNESEPNAMTSIGEGDTYIVHFVDYLDSAFPVSTSTWQVIMQFKNDSTGSPPIEIKVGNGQYYLDGNNGAWHYNIGPAVVGKPLDIAVEVHFSADPTKSWMSAWYGGTQVLSAVAPKGAGTLYKGQTSYLKTGIYRDTAITQTGTRYLESLVIGKPV